MNNHIPTNNEIPTNTPPETSWRKFLGKEKITITEDSEGFKINDPQDPNLQYSVSLEEVEEIRTSNNALRNNTRNSIKEKVDKTDYSQPLLTDNQPWWREFLGHTYLDTRWESNDKHESIYKIRDIWNPEIRHPISEQEYQEIQLVNEKYQLQDINDEQLREK
jgi:hypothetical protein